MLKLEWLKQRLAEPFGEECVEWPWSVGSHGYGQLFVREGGKRKGYLAHRISCEEHYGPSDDHALHSCDNRKCFNPKHLRWGTPKDNTGDALSRNRLVGPHNPCCGREHHSNKLTADDVRSIRRQYSYRLFGITTLAKKFGVSTTVVYRIVHRKIWKHIE